VLPSFTKKYLDQSDETAFSFIFYCDICHKPWKSTSIPFSLSSDKKGLWQRFLRHFSPAWDREHEDAFERANREAMFYFNRCQDCGLWVCDDDFSEEMDQCIQCQKTHNKKL